MIKVGCGIPTKIVLLAMTSLGLLMAADRAVAVACNPKITQSTMNLGTVTTNPAQECVFDSTIEQCTNLTFSGYGPFSLEHTFTFTIGCVTTIWEVTYTGSYAVPGYIRPKYQVVGVYYAPPGAKSTATYSNGFMSGTSTNVSNSFGVNVTASVTANYGVDLFGILDANSSTTTNYGWEQQQNGSSSISIVQNQSTGSTWPGPASSTLGVDHEYDTIAIWLNPEMGVEVSSPSGVTVTGYYFDPRDPANAPDIIYLTVGELDGSQAIPSGGTQTALARAWDTDLGGLDATDFAAILQADPFYANPSFDPNTDTSGRYVLPGGVDQIFSYEPEPQGAQASATVYTSSYNSTDSSSQGGSDKYTVGYTIDGTLSASFFGTALGQLKASTTFTYTNTWSNTVTSGASQSANFTIYRPLYTDNYTGPINMQIWKDNVYGTFMFYPVD